MSWLQKAKLAKLPHQAFLPSRDSRLGNSSANQRITLRHDSPRDHHFQCERRSALHHEGGNRKGTCPGWRSEPKMAACGQVSIPDWACTFSGDTSGTTCIGASESPHPNGVVIALFSGHPLLFPQLTSHTCLRCFTSFID